MEIATQAQDQQPVIIKTPPLPLTILDPSKNNKDAGIPKDIKPPRKPLYFWERPWVARSLLLSLLGTSVALWLLWKSRRRRRRSEGAPEDLASPEEIFERDLESLMKADYLTNGRFREFHFGLSAAFRRYLDNKYALDTQSLTSGELLRLLHQERHRLDIQLSTLIKIKESLEISDLAKFAKYAPPAQENERAVSLLMEFILTHRTPELAPTQSAPAKTTGAAP